MTKLTPTFADQHRANGNGATPILHVMPAHEPTGEGEQPPMAGQVAIQPAPVAVAAPLKIALIGTAPSSRMLAPYNDPSWKIWACSPGNMNALPRVDVWFELHSNLLWPEHESYGRPYIEWLKVQQFPVYMQDQTQISRATVFPKDELVAEHGRFFFTSSFSWMMALAIKMGCSELGLYGIDMASRDEYVLQRSGGQYFIQTARQRGINVVIPNESDLAQPPPLYGYADSNPHMRKWLARRAEIKGRVSGMTGQRDQLTNQITYLNGADEDMDYNISIWGGLADDVTILETQNAKLKQENEQLRASITAIQDSKLSTSAPSFLPMTFTYPAVQEPVVQSSPQEIENFISEVQATSPQPKKRKKLSGKR